MQKSIPSAGIVLLGALCMALLSWLQPAPAHAQAEPTAPDAPANNGWTFTDVIRVGQQGFTQLSSGRAGPNGVVVVSGQRNGSTGLFHVHGGTVTAVATDGTVLPGGLGALSDVGASSFQYAVLPDGDVLFKARASGGSLNPAFRYTFRWSEGTISVAQPSTETDPATQSQAFEHELAQVTTDSRWLATLASGTFPNTSTDYGLTNGTARQSLFSFTRSAANCVFDTVLLAGANAGGVIAHYRVQQSTPQVGSICQGATTRTWSVNLAGGATGTVAGGASTENGNTYTGTELSSSDLLLVNNQNQVAAVREVHNSPTTFLVREQLVVFSGGSEMIVQDTDGPASGIFLADFDNQGNVLYSTGLDSDFLATVLLAGPDLENDRVLRTGDSLFGQTVVSLGWVARPAAVGDATRAFAFTYALNGGGQGIAVASRQRPRWTNPAGGNWGTANNWTPAAIPGAGSNVIFDLPATYAVTLGTQQAGSVDVKNGDVILRSGTLMLTVADAAVSISGADAGTTARLTLQNAEMIATSVSLGFGGPGELRVEGARLYGPDGAESVSALLGFTAPATATVTAGGIWTWREMAVGINQPSLLRVEDGALVGFGSNRLTVGGFGLAQPLSSRSATVIATNASNNPGTLDLGTLLGPVANLIIGETLVGRLEVRDGAKSVAVTTTVGTRDHGTVADGFLTVEGTNASEPARFESGSGDQGGLFVAAGAGTDGQVTVSSGGVMPLPRLSLADGAQSTAVLFVDGLEAADGGERRSTVTAPFAPAVNQAAATSGATGDCVIGNVGQGALNVSFGGLVHCRQIAVGMATGSRGAMNIDGILRSINARVVAEGPRAEDGAICIGRAALCGASSGSVRGEVIVGLDGILEGRIIGIGNGGWLRGSGLAIAREGVVVFDGGSVAPGIVQLSGGQRSAALAQQTGTLTIQGNVTVSTTGVITLHVLGATAAVQDRLVVSGALTLDGDLAINFGNGYAPKQGDQFLLIQATTLVGTPRSVTIGGLEPGFDYDLDVSGGTLHLTALNDGQAVETEQSLYLPMIRRTD